MFKNRFLLVLGVISLLLVTLAVSRPYSSAMKSSVDLGKPARPMIIPLSQISNLPDYYQRHPELRAKSVDLSMPARPVIIPLSRISNLPDYFQRHPELRASAGMTIDMMRYRTRNQKLSSLTIDLSDYFLRH